MGQMTGTVKFFNHAKGFGFITPDGGGSDIFVHISAVQASGLPGIEDGQTVTVDVRGRPLECEVVKPPFVQAKTR